MDYQKTKELVANTKGFTEIKFPELDLSIFTYQYSKYENFQIDPMMKWCRGLTFVNKSIVYPMLPKFFNVNENEGNMLEDLKHMKIKLVTEKRDGSLIMPIKLNNTIKFKTMKSINNRITNKCETLFLSKYNSFINTYIDKYSLLFEYTAPNNKIVVEYDMHNLSLIAMIDRFTFNIMDYEEMLTIVSKYTIKVVKSINVDNWDDLINMTQTVENKEGWVITLEDKNGDQKMVKLKTEWYSSLHGNFQSINRRELPISMIIKLVLTNKLDDVMPYVQNEERKKQIIDIESKINTHCDSIFNIIRASLNLYLHKFVKDKRKYVDYLRNPVNELTKYMNIILTSIGNGKYQITTIENMYIRILENISLNKPIKIVKRWNICLNYNSNN